jgi:GntR family transcriptional regulator
MPALPPTVSDTAAPTLGAGASTPAFSPLYQQIKGLILQSLEAGEWRPGELIPSEMELAARFRVSQGTVRKAIDELAAENLAHTSPYKVKPRGFVLNLEDRVLYPVRRVT